MVNEKRPKVNEINGTAMVVEFASQMQQMLSAKITAIAVRHALCL